MFGNRGIYHKGWTAVTRHQHALADRAARSCPPSTTMSGSSTTRKRTGARRTTWPSESEKLHELQRLWLIEATSTTCCRSMTIRRARQCGHRRPAALIKGKRQILFGGMGRLAENCVVNIKNKSHSVTAEMVVPESGAEGVIIAQGGNIGGWSLYAKNGKLKYCYNFCGVHRYTSRARDRSRRARTRCAWSSPTTAAAWPRAARSRCTSTARRSARARRPDRGDGLLRRRDLRCRRRIRLAGHRGLSGSGNEFSGEVNWVVQDRPIADAAENADHLVSPARGHTDRNGAAVEEVS